MGHLREAWNARPALDGAPGGPLEQRYDGRLACSGEWRSSVAHLLWEQAVGSSNLPSPTTLTRHFALRASPRHRPCISDVSGASAGGRAWRGSRGASRPSASSARTGRPRRRHRHRDRAAPAETARHVLSQPAARPPLEAAGPEGRRARHGGLARPPLRRLPHRHLGEGAGAVPVGDPAHRAGPRRVRLDRLDREDVAGWINDLAAAGSCRTQHPGLPQRPAGRAGRRGRGGPAPRSPAARVACPGTSPAGSRGGDRGVDREEVDQFLAATAAHRWAAGFRLGVLYGLRRSELLALRGTTSTLKGDAPG